MVSPTTANRIRTLVILIFLIMNQSFLTGRSLLDINIFKYSVTAIKRAILNLVPSVIVSSIRATQHKE